MKITSLVFYLIFTTLSLSADKNWIPLKPVDKAKAPEKNTQLDANPSQTEPINKIMKNVMLIKELIDHTKEEKSAANEKNWFVLNGENSK